MKKKLLTLVLALSLMGTLVACGGNENNEEVETSQTEVEETEEVEEAEENGKDNETVDYDHEHGDYEWIGEFELEEGEYMLHFGESPDETLDVGFVKLGDNIADLEHHAEHLMVVEDKEIVKQDAKFEARPDYVYSIEMDPEHGHVYFEIKEAGRYALVTEHHPSENNLQVFGDDDIEIMPDVEHEGHDH